MATAVELLCECWTTPAVDEVRWQAWLEDGRVRERRDSARRIAALKCFAIGVLLAGVFGAVALRFGFNVVLTAASLAWGKQEI
jgi:hypothetical protein